MLPAQGVVGELNALAHVKNVSGMVPESKS